MPFYPCNNVKYEQNFVGITEIISGGGLMKFTPEPQKHTISVMSTNGTTFRGGLNFTDNTRIWWPFSDGGFGQPDVLYTETFAKEISYYQPYDGTYFATVKFED